MEQNLKEVELIRPCFYLLFCLWMASCASRLPEKKRPFRVNFDLTDKHGQYLIKWERGHRGRGDVVVKKQILGLSGEGRKVLEKVISISKKGDLSRKIPFLRPEISQYTVWFEGKKYFSELKLNEKNRSLDIRLESPEQQWKGRSSVPFPEKKSLYCFFEQLIECIKTTGFIHKAIKKQKGKKRLFVIWNGYPYFQEQYENIPQTVFSKSLFEYDGETPKGEIRFTLSTAGQAIFYFLDSHQELLKKFWVAQGLTMIKSDIQ